MENLPFILGVITPPIFYALIIYFSSPLKSLNWKSSLKAIAAGVASVTVVYTFNAFFPTWDAWTLAVFVSKMYLVTINKNGESYD